MKCSTRYPSEILARVAVAEREIVPLSADSKRRARFLQLGRWLVEQSLAVSLLRGRITGRSVPAPASVAEAGVFRLIWMLAASPRVEGACAAQVIHAKTHPGARVRDQVRAFYLARHPFTLKLLPPERRDALARELEGRRRAPAAFEMPRVFDHSLHSPIPYLCEEFVRGRRPSWTGDADRILDFVLGVLWKSHLEVGFEWRRCAEAHDLKRLVENFDALATRAEWRPRWPEHRHWRDALMRLEIYDTRFVPLCHGHGDLTTANMLISNGHVRLLDWEKARPIPLLQDLTKIFAACPTVWTAVRARLEDRLTDAPAPGMVPPNAQFALATLERLRDLALRFSVRPDDPRQAKREAARLRTRLDAILGNLSRVLFADGS